MTVRNAGHMLGGENEKSLRAKNDFYRRSSWLG